ncbi:MAG TPA: cytochrome c [Anaerolineae bacterium]
MNRKWLKALAILLGLPLVVVGCTYGVSELLLNRVYRIPDDNLTIPTDPAAVERGRHLVETIGACQDCHGHSLSGDLWLDEPLLGVIPAANLTPGKGGIGLAYEDADWERAIRHGVGRDGRPLLGVSAIVLHQLSDADVAAMIAYLKTLRPFDREMPPRRIGPLARPFIVLLTGEILPATAIDHDTPPPAPEPGVTVEYGRYLAGIGCVDCHHDDLSGGSDPGEGMNITTGGNLGKWTEAEFIRTIRTGRTPDGDWLNTGVDGFPRQRLSRLTDDELRAIWLYIQSLPPVQKRTVRSAEATRAAP